MTLYVNKLESPSHKDALCQVCLKLVMWFWRRNFTSGQCIFTILQFSPLLKGVALPLNKLESLFPKNMLCEKFGWNYPSGSGKQDENVKSLQTDRQQTDRHTDDGTTGGQKSSLKLSAQVS